MRLSASDSSNGLTYGLPKDLKRPMAECICYQSLLGLSSRDYVRFA